MISVVTPCLNLYCDNRVDYFEKMMESIHKQTYSDIEHIVVDGGSLDGTLNLLEDYKRKGWIDKLISEKDSGIYSALNKGIKLARGEYVNIMNTDDYFTDLNYFTEAVSILQAQDFDFVHADKLVKAKDGASEYIKRGDESVAFFRMPFRHQTIVMRKSVFDDIGTFDESYIIAADYKFVLETLMAGKKGEYIPRVVLCSRDGGVSTDRETCIKEVGRVIHEVYGSAAGLSMSDCVDIYIRKISPQLFSMISEKIEDPKILSSLKICYQLSQQVV